MRSIIFCFIIFLLAASLLIPYVSNLELPESLHIFIPIAIMILSMFIQMDKTMGIKMAVQAAKSTEPRKET